MALVDHRPLSLVLFAVAIVATLIGAVVIGAVALVAGVLGMVVLGVVALVAGVFGTLAPVALPPLNVAVGNVALIAMSSFAMADILRPNHASPASPSSMHPEHGPRVKTPFCGLYSSCPPPGGCPRSAWITPECEYRNWPDRELA